MAARFAWAWARVVPGLSRPTPRKAVLARSRKDACHFVGEQALRHPGWNPEIGTEDGIDADEAGGRDTDHGEDRLLSTTVRPTISEAPPKRVCQSA